MIVRVIARLRAAVTLRPFNPKPPPRLALPEPRHDRRAVGEKRHERRSRRRGRRDRHRRIVSQAVLTRAALDRRNPLTSETLVGQQRRGTLALRRARIVARAIPSSIDWLAPCPRCGSIGCAASPSSVRRPRVQVGSGSRSYSAHRNVVRTWLSNDSDPRVPASELAAQHVGIAGRRPGFLHLLVRRNETDVVDEFARRARERSGSACLCRATSASDRSASAECDRAG